MTDFPWYIWLLVLAATAGIPALTAAGLYRPDAGGRRRTMTVTVGFAVVWAAWITTSGVLAAHDTYRQAATTAPPWIAIAGGGALIVAVAAGLTPAARRALAGTRGLARLTIPHVFRIAGLAFLLAMALGKVPAAFALPAGLGDLSVAISAPFIARRLAAGSRRGAVWFNILGIIDLVVAVTIGFLGGLGPDRLGITPSTADLGTLPLALIPSTAVPLAVALHVISLVRLRRSRVPAAVATVPA